MQLATGTITLVGLLSSYYMHLIEAYRGQQNIDFWLLTVLRQGISLQDRYMGNMQKYAEYTKELKRYVHTSFVEFIAMETTEFFP